MPRTINLFQERVWVPAHKPFRFIEKIDPKTGEKKYILRGLMLPFGKISRNNVLYNKESIIEHHKQLIGRPVMYNHKIEGDELPMGHYISSYIVETADEEHPLPGWYYEADIDPHETKIIRKLNRGDLRHTSIQLVGDRVEERMGDDGAYSEAYVSDIIEASLVPAPGFLDTTALFSEAFNKKKIIRETYHIGDPVRMTDGRRGEIVDEIDGEEVYLIQFPEGLKLKARREHFKKYQEMTPQDFDARHGGHVRNKLRQLWVDEGNESNFILSAKSKGYNDNQINDFLTISRREFKRGPSNVNTQYEEPRYDGDCYVCPYGLDAESPEKMAERMVRELGENKVKQILKEHLR